MLEIVVKTEKRDRHVRVSAEDMAGLVRRIGGGVTGSWWSSGYPICPTSSPRSGTRPAVTTRWSTATVLPTGTSR